MKGTQIMKEADTEKQGLGTGQGRLSPIADVAMRMVAVVLVIAGAVIGFGKPIAIVLVVAGLLLLILEQTFKHLPRRPAH